MMMTTTRSTRTLEREGLESETPDLEAADETLAIVSLLPRPGEWEAEDYLWFTDRTNHLVELSDGRIKVLPMPTDLHQGIVIVILNVLLGWTRSSGSGVVRMAPLRLRLTPDQFREPDVLLLLDAEDPRRANQFWSGADLVVEVISRSNPEHDLVTKRAEYAAAGIPEYWIVDAEVGTLAVLTLGTSKDGAYAEHGVFGAGDLASSPLLAGLVVDVAAVLTG